MTTEARPAVEFDITPEDWERVNAEHVFASPLYAEAARNLRVVVGLLAVTLSALAYLIGSSSVAFLFLLAAAPLVASVGPLTRHAQRNSLRKLARQGVANGVFGHHHVEIRSDGLFHSTHAYDSLIRWHAIERVEEVAGHFFVYTGPNAFLPIPVTAFRDGESLRCFADAFQERMAATDRLPSGAPG
jgi:hypothetical protein